MTNLPAFACRHQANDLALKSEPFGGRTAEILGADAFAEAKREIDLARGSSAYNHMIVNDDLERAISETCRIITLRQTESPGS